MYAVVYVDFPEGVDRWNRISDKRVLFSALKKRVFQCVIIIFTVAHRFVLLVESARNCGIPISVYGFVEIGFSCICLI